MAVAVALACGPGSASAWAKEDHFEQVKLRLIELNVRCTTCHPAADANPAGDAKPANDTKPSGAAGPAGDAAPRVHELTLYGQRLADVGESVPLAERVARMERRLPQILTAEERREAALRVDVDGDGALNWVEILTGFDPSDGKSVPPVGDGATSLRGRVESVVSCKLCHTADASELRRGDAPHNAFGEVLAALGKAATPARPGQPAPGRGRPGSAPPAGAEPPSDILERLLKVQHLDADRDRARNWDEIASFHHPADPADAPSAEEVKVVRAAAAALKRGAAGFGAVHAAP